AGDIYGGSARTRGAQIAESMRTHRSTADARGYLYQLGAGLAWSSLGILPLISSPTLILAGTDDPLIPVANAHILHRMVRGSELTLYHGGHLGLVSEAEVLAPVIEEFLDR
ncbi:MAG TPA: alpha/beta hydrolase, partial [Actinomycetota bacterium]|nr:alpha/beta hydrolase [Actinomycetota bacterium]